jgi:glycosyltransferase involved in cell wall biosynthesis
VLFIINRLLTGGAERHLVELICRGVSKRRFSADVVLLKSRGDPAGPSRQNDLTPALQESGVQVRDGWLRHKYDASAISQLLRFTAQTRPDVVYTHTGANELFLSAIVAALQGVRTTCAVHTTKKTGAGERFSVLQRILMRRASAVVGLAPSHRQYLIAAEGLNPARTTYIYHGVDENQFHPRTGARPNLVAALAERRVIGVVGNLLPDKGHHILIEALPRVIEQHPDVSLVFAGNDPSPSGEIKAALQAQAQRLGLADRVVLLGHRSDVACILAGLDVFVLPSLRETFSMAILEAMACGLPVVITNVGSLQEMVANGHEGFIVEPNDLTALADRLNLVLSDRGRAKAIGIAARHRVERDFTLDRMVDQYANLFDRLVQCNR